jgi:hypothetical protein
MSEKESVAKPEPKPPDPSQRQREGQNTGIPLSLRDRRGGEGDHFKESTRSAIVG